ncbi:protein-glutamate methylesterase/protein-glutamine glutaminase [Chitinilyticum piscinae]|uniref:Protein-glutamate methylesterase/protein-glutamine glutaminase n=1 Tax=Chitinilyticum piscinae TaxID=2866724 RepID=A0A8J7FIL3_9NEIS|nr:chemotaxis response regulator protein-glutamate methylesterase [Chitinilyticum piscinae]MBE9608097.1 chemotaxis response regulator protein-glutamate methylesterase [Chitinilyticum piscinae]
MIKLMVIDDSALVRQRITDCMARTSDIRVCAAASDPLQAESMLARDQPDVVVLDLDLPRMDGISFLRKLMSERPLPVVVFSVLATQGSAKSIQALQAGAVQILAKSPGQQATQEFEQLATLVRQAARTTVRAIRSTPIPRGGHARALQNADAILPAPEPGARIPPTERIVLIGASTGGTQALEQILSRLSVRCPPIAIVQHMPGNLTASFARRLDQQAQITVREARNGDRMQSGQALIAPGGKHLLIKRQGNNYCVEVVDGPAVTRHCPSVDVLFRSGARFAGANAVGMLLTGIGEDGARGLKEMRDAGAHTVAQDAETCVVFGMPKEAIGLDAAVDILPLGQMASVIERSRRA